MNSETPLKFFVVDNEMIAVTMMSKILEHAGHQVVEVIDQKRAG